MDCTDVVAKVKPSIALVITLDSAGALQGTGSGFVYGKNNIVVTCNHVVKTAASIVLKFPDATLVPAKVVLRDDEHDLALLKFDGSDQRPPLEAATDEVKEGMPVIFSGYPLSMQDLTTHQGILSAITKDEVGMTTYLIDGTVNSGNSGCPLMNIKGEVIGVVNAKRRESSNLLSAVEKLEVGAVSLHGIDLVNIYKALIRNVQLGIGYAVPASFIPEHKDIEEPPIVVPPIPSGQPTAAAPTEGNKISEQAS